jgi:hypothetical protein
MEYNDESYLKWEAGCIVYAESMAQDLIDEFNGNDDIDGVVCSSYTSNQSKEVKLYILMKVWQILIGSGLFMDYTVHTKKDKSLVDIIVRRKICEDVI